MSLPSFSGLASGDGFDSILSFIVFKSLYEFAVSISFFNSSFLVLSVIASIAVWTFSLYLFNSSIADVLAEFNSSIVAFSLSIIAFNSAYFLSFEVFQLLLKLHF
ncbi:hypothetical protein ONA23_02150 [Mycoplasmopsis cynos]|uniref:hypothetical protein n=1 Tax=Mycoplasmopsis cynos TaxID=171284 RepID=UPI0024CA6B94|nr:hypothetical protein [Mycoplasmopsis cynos]WAM06981.1 hypothetical protein ONA23_02150 [Mycoplasmopsis cynos]